MLDAFSVPRRFRTATIMLETYMNSGTDQQIHTTRRCTRGD
jgi:hypothetical protein